MAVSLRDSVGWQGVLGLLACAFVSVVGTDSAFAQKDRIVGRLAHFGQMQTRDAEDLRGRVTLALQKNAAQNTGYDAIRKRVGKRLFGGPGNTRAEYARRLEQVRRRLHAGLDETMLEVLILPGKNPARQCTMELGLSLSDCDILVAAASQRRVLVPYVPADNGSAALASMQASGVRSHHARRIVSAIERVMVNAPASLGQGVRHQQFASLLHACPGALTNWPAQVRAWNLGPTEGMVRCIGTQISRASGDPSTLAKSLFALRRSEARALVQWATGGGDDPGEVAVETGKKLLASGDYAKAAAAFDEATQIDPSSADAWIGRGQALLALEKAPQAIQALSSALRIRPDDAELHALVGDAHAAAGEPDEAMGAYKQATALHPKNKRARAGIKRVQPMLAQKAAEAWREKGKKHFRANQFRIAANAYEKAAEASPEDSRSFAGLGASRLALGEASAAITAYQRATRLAPQHAGHWAQLGASYQKMGDFEKAAHAYQKSLSIQPRNADVKTRLAALQPKDSKADAKPGPSDGFVEALLDDPLNEKNARRGLNSEDMPTLPEEGEKVADVEASAGDSQDPTPEPDVETKSVVSASAELPETPSRVDVMATLRPLRKRLSYCAGGRHGRVTFDISVAGASGRVTNITSKESGASIPGYDCMLHAVRGAQFPRFKKDKFSVQFPFAL